MTEETEEYLAFVEKFKPKKTTDDCYTPQNIFNVIAEYAAKRYGFDVSQIVRPFYPGGDYEHFSYPDGCVVLDNPPFSIITKIVRWYNSRDIKYFLFCPSLTCFHSLLSSDHSTVIITSSNITYENGACVRTAFITNLGDGSNVAETDYILGDLIEEQNKQNLKAQKKQVTKLSLPDEIITAARMQYFARHNTDFKVPRAESLLIKKLDNYSKGIFGGAFLLSERAAAERAAAERAAAERAAAERAAAERAAAERAAAERAAAERVELSDREKQIQKMIGKVCTNEENQNCSAGGLYGRRDRNDRMRICERGQSGDQDGLLQIEGRGNFCQNGNGCRSQNGNGGD